MKLLRREYAHPDILFAVAQVFVGWSDEEMVSVCAAIAPSLAKEFGDLNPRTRFSLQMEARDGQHGSSVATSHPAGFECRLDEKGSVIIVGPEGVLTKYMAPYPGREALFAPLLRALDLIREAGFEPPARRVSVALRNHIEPRTDESYAIEDYVVPKYDFGRDELGLYVRFKHDVHLDLGALRENLLGQVILETTNEGLGIDVTVDIMDFTEGGFSSVEHRLRFVKDVESHVFECTITDETRKLYGAH